MQHPLDDVSANNRRWWNIQVPYMFPRRHYEFSCFLVKCYNLWLKNIKIQESISTWVNRTNSFL